MQIYINNNYSSVLLYNRDLGFNYWNAHNGHNVVNVSSTCSSYSTKESALNRHKVENIIYTTCCILAQKCIEKITIYLIYRYTLTLPPSIDFLGWDAPTTIKLIQD